MLKRSMGDQARKIFHVKLIQNGQASSCHTPGEKVNLRALSRPKKPEECNHQVARLKPGNAVCLEAGATLESQWPNTSMLYTSWRACTTRPCSLSVLLQSWHELDVLAPSRSLARSRPDERVLELGVRQQVSQ